MTNPYDEKTFGHLYYKGLGTKGKELPQIEWLIKNFDFETFLEIGPGKGDMLRSMKETGKKVTGVEYVKYAIEHLQPKDEVEIINAPIWNMEELTKTFDLVLSIAVLQFIPMEERENAAKEIYRVTKKWAILVIPSFPQAIIGSESWVVPPDEYEKRKDTDEHLVRFEPPEFWQELFEKQGFKRVFDKGLIPVERREDTFFVFEKQNE